MHIFQHGVRRLSRQASAEKRSPQMAGGHLIAHIPAHWWLLRVRRFSGKRPRQRSDLLGPLARTDFEEAPDRSSPGCEVARRGALTTGVENWRVFQARRPD